MGQVTLRGDIFPRSSISTKLPSYTPPSGAPMSEAEQEAYREKVREVVFGVWYNFRRPACLAEIYFGVKEEASGKILLSGVRSRVQQLIRDGCWAFATFARSKRSVDRRVNEAASPDFYSDNLAMIVSVNPGVFQPNPEVLGGT